MEPTQLIGAGMWLAMMVLAGFAVYRVRTRRSHIGAAAAGTIYDIVQDEKRKAIEIVVAGKAAAHDFEHADDDDEPKTLSPQPPTVSSTVRRCPSS